MRLPDLLAERPLVLFGKWRGEPRGRIVIRGFGANGPLETSIDVGRAAPRDENAPLRVLWARKWVELLDDEMHLGAAKEIEEAITDLGLSHRILTAYTSFVAVDSEVVNKTGGAATVTQPLPLPEGVENSAVGGAPPAQVASRRAMAMPMAMPATAPPPAPAPASPPAEAYGALGAMGSGRGAGMADARKSESFKAKAAESERARPEAKDDRAAPKIEFAAEQAQGLGDVSALREAVRKALLRASAGCLAPGELQLRLTIDADGKVLRVELLASPDAASGHCAEQALKGLAGGTKPIARGIGTWTVTIRVVR
jgi:hypothetical protein